MKRKYRLPLIDRKCAVCGVIAVIAGVVLLLAATASGDEIDDSLQPDTPQAVKASTRQAIHDGLDKDTIIGFTRAMLQNKFHPQQVQRAHALMVEAKNGGMPVQKIADKAFEGIAKNVDPAMIVQAMELVHSRNTYAYKNAARISKSGTQAAKLGDLISSGLAAGLAQQDADRLINSIEQRSRSSNSASAQSLALACFEIARDISRLGVESQSVADMVSGALKKGLSEEDIHAMRSAFLTGARQTNPRELVQSFSLSIAEGKGFQEGSGSHAGSGKSSGGVEPGSPGSGDHGGGQGGPGSGSDGSGGSGGSGGGPGSGGAGSGGNR